MTKIKLRDYQENALKSILGAVKEGTRLQVCVLATGLGKTIIFSHLPPIVAKQGKRTLVLAHREELLDQAKKKIQWVSSVSVGIEQGNRKAGNEDVVVASIQTLGRKGSKRIQKFNPDEFGLIIIDECHHATASSYENILEYFGANKKGTIKETPPVVVGFTATPIRSDKEGLDTVFDAVVFNFPILKGIEKGWLAPIKAFTVFTNVDLDKVSTRMGDFATKELSQAVNEEDRNKLIVDTYKSKSPGEKAIIFAVDIAHCHSLQESFKKQGINAGVIIGDTSTQDRQKLYERYESDPNFNVMINCNVLTEGFDMPCIQVVMLARPTKSPGLFVQMAGRGLRLHEGKDHVKLIDFVDNLKKNSIQTASSLIGIDKPMNVEGVDLLEAKEKYEELLLNDPKGMDQYVPYDELDKYIEEVDITKLSQLSEDVKEHSLLTWTQITDKWFRLGLSEEPFKYFYDIKHTLVGWTVTGTKLKKVKPTFKNKYRAWEPVKTKRIKKDEKITTMEGAFYFADEFVYKRHEKSLNLVKQDSPWRKEPATPKQVKLLKKFGHPNGANLTKGEASSLLSKIFEKRKNEKTKKTT